MRPTMLISGVLFLALVGQVELFKLFKHQPAVVQPSTQQPQPQLFEQQTEQPIEQQQERLQSQPLYLAPPAPQPARPLFGSPFYAPVPAQAQQPELIRQPEPGAGTKGAGGQDQRNLRAPVQGPLFASAPSFTYLIVRPVNQQPQPQQYQFLDPYRYSGRGFFSGHHAYPSGEASYFRQNEQSSDQGTKGGHQRQNDELQQQQQEVIEQQQQIIEQQHENQQEQQQPQPQPQAQAAIVIPIAPGKEGKLKALLDKIRSKLTLGSSYEVISEEFVHQAPVKQPPIEQQHVVEELPPQQQPLAQQQIEQEQQKDLGLHEDKQQQQQQIVQEQQFEQQQLQLSDLPARQQGAKGQRFEETKGNALKQEEIKSLRQEEVKGNFRQVAEETKSSNAKRYPERPPIQQHQLPIEQQQHQIRQNESNGQLKTGY